jgi:hypothetical protein
VAWSGDLTRAQGEFILAARRELRIDLADTWIDTGR